MRVNSTPARAGGKAFAADGPTTGFGHRFPRIPPFYALCICHPPRKPTNVRPVARSRQYSNVQAALMNVEQRLVK
jgi:hypothetical protein